MRVYGTCCLSRPKRCEKNRSGHVRTMHVTKLDDAKEIARLLRRFRRKPRLWPLLDALIERRPGFGCADILKAAQEPKGLARLLRSLSDADLEPLVETYFKALEKSVSEDTRQHYRSAIRQVIPAMVPFPASKLTAAYVTAKREGWSVRSGTARKRITAIKLFSAWLKRRGVYRRDPLTDLELPKPGKPRDLHLEPWEAQALADAQPSPYRELSALLAGTGIEVSTALRLTRRDVDTVNKEIRAAGTKTWNRDRIVRVADWAWPYVLDACPVGFMPATRIFCGIPDRWVAMDHHNAAIYGDKEKGIKGLVEQMPRLDGYTMRDARHTYAVRAIRGGADPVIVAEQLGHKDAVLVLRVYGKYRPKQQERDRAERLASAADELRKKEQDG